MSSISAFCPQYSGGTYEDHYEIDGPLFAEEGEARSWLDSRRDPANSYGEAEHLRVFALTIESPAPGAPTQISREMVYDEVFEPAPCEGEDGAEPAPSPEELAAQAAAREAEAEAAALQNVEDWNRAWAETHQNRDFVAALDAQASAAAPLFARVEILPLAGEGALAVGFDKAGLGTALGRMADQPRVGVVTFPFPLYD